MSDDTVVKCHSLCDAIVIPDRSVIPFVIVTVYLVLRLKGGIGSNLIVELLSTNLILPWTGLPLGSFIENISTVIVEPRIGALNVAVITELTSSPTDPSIGFISVISIDFPSPSCRFVPNYPLLFVASFHKIVLNHADPVVLALVYIE